MSVELQTGTECLVSDASDAELYAGIQGAGNYILRKPLELSMIDSNTLSVGAGTGLQNGRHIRFKGTTEFSIPSGVQAQKRSNIAVVRTTISRDESTMKTLTHSEPIVLSGEPVAEGDPVDPAWIEGDLLAGDAVADFPIARVVTDGINVGEPEPLFDVLQSAKDRWDSQSQWIDISDRYTYKETLSRSNLSLSVKTNGVFLDVIFDGRLNGQFNLPGQYLARGTITPALPFDDWMQDGAYSSSAQLSAVLFPSEFMFVLTAGTSTNNGAVGFRFLVPIA